jgi:hypothetical protein
VNYLVRVPNAGTDLWINPADITSAEVRSVRRRRKPTVYEARVWLHSGLVYAEEFLTPTKAREAITRFGVALYG